MVVIHADGAYNPVLDQGGWAAVVVGDSQRHVFSGTAKKTTGNRMEITSALEGVVHTPPDSEITVYTDSQYLYGCMAKGWQRRANRDLWEKLDVAAGQRRVHWQWIDRNTDNPLHQEAHNLATNLASHGEKQPHVISEGKGRAKAPLAGTLTHIDELGRPKMVDVTGKPVTQREAVAKCMVRMKPATFELLKKGNISKGDVLAVAQLAGIMAAKQTASLIPLCHPILVDEVKVEFNLDEGASAVEITTIARSTGKTGVEMEALTAAAVAGLTIYDMCKAVDRGIQIDQVRLIRKSGGKSGTIHLE